MPRETRVAYFSMEIALHPEIPTYSGGLGVLAGDTLRSAADIGLPMVGITMVSRFGYLRQEIDHILAELERLMGGLIDQAERRRGPAPRRPGRRRTGCLPCAAPTQSSSEEDKPASL